MSSSSVYKLNDEIYIQTWKKHVSQKQILKFIPNKKNDLFSYLQKSNEGRLCLNYMQDLKKNAHNKNNSNFLLIVDSFSKHLENFPTLIPYFPIQILENLKMLRKFANTNEMKYIIYLTKDHTLTCNFCHETLKGNEAKKAICLCSTQFYHHQCFNSIQGKCKICSYNFDS